MTHLLSRDPHRIDAETTLIGLIGHPVAHSLSPFIHNHELRRLGLNYRYLAFDVEPDRFAEAVSGLVAVGARGANVTIPHKQHAAALADELSPAAEAVGAVNTLVVERGKGRTRIIGDNTDVVGFLAPLAASRDRILARPAVVFGSGGAARAVVHALVSLAIPRVVVVARNPVRSQSLLRDIGRQGLDGAVTVASPEVLEAVAESVLVVNATPVGMADDVLQSPLHDAAPLGRDHVVYDLIYSPSETRLMREARARGSTVIGGLHMLVHQAAHSFELWTGESMDTVSMIGLLESRLTPEP